MRKLGPGLITGAADDDPSGIATYSQGGAQFGFLPIDPIKALFWSAVINGVISIPIMAVMMLMAADRKVMGQFVVSPRLKWLGWATAALMALAVVAMFTTME